MKTAISVPDDTFDKATARARELGMSRSEFFSRAADRYLHELDRGRITNQINDALGEQPDADESNAVAAELGRRRLFADRDDW